MKNNGNFRSHCGEKTAARAPWRREQGVSLTDGSHQGAGAWIRKSEVKGGCVVL